MKLKCDTLPLNFAFKFNLRRNNQAVALDPEDVSFITNKAAVNFEKQDYEACIKNCEDAIEKGRELRVEYKMIGRAMTRKVRSSRAR